MMRPGEEADDASDDGYEPYMIPEDEEEEEENFGLRRAGSGAERRASRQPTKSRFDELNGHPMVRQLKAALIIQAWWRGEAQRRRVSSQPGGGPSPSSSHSPEQPGKASSPRHGRSLGRLLRRQA